MATSLSIARSSNRATFIFYNVGQHLGVDRIAAWAHALGFGKKSGIDLDNEKTGTIPSSAMEGAPLP